MMLKHIIISSLAALMAYGASTYHNQKLITVDVSKIIKTASEEMAREQMSVLEKDSTQHNDLVLEKMKAKLSNFKIQLDESLEGYGRLKKVIVINKSFAWGDTADATDDFIKFHNGEGEKP